MTISASFSVNMELTEQQLQCVSKALETQLVEWAANGGYTEQQKRESELLLGRTGEYLFKISLAHEKIQE